jgi:hypothetical protein
MELETSKRQRLDYLKSLTIQEKRAAVSCYRCVGQVLLAPHIARPIAL